VDELGEQKLNVWKTNKRCNKKKDRKQELRKRFEGRRQDEKIGGRLWREGL
jgi:hypothetical protein